MLDGLERRVDLSNQNLKAAAAALRQAEEIVAEARAGYFPTGTVNFQAERSRSSGSASSGAGSASFVSQQRRQARELFQRRGGGELDSRFVGPESAAWSRPMSPPPRPARADLANARLSAQGTLAGDYLQLRIADELKRLLDQSAIAYAESLRITQNQYRSGTADQSAVSQAQAQLQSTQAQAIATGVTRAQFEHAIAVLIGVPPAELTIAPSDQVIEIPDIPPGLPSALLERRPDVAAAERTMASANAEIGVEVAAFYPTITLSADAGTPRGVIVSADRRDWRILVVWRDIGPDGVRCRTA